MKTFSVLLLAVCSVLPACQTSHQSNVSVDVNSPSTRPLPSIAASPSPLSTTVSNMKEAEYNGYLYSYKRDGDTTVAMFVKRFLPRDDTIVVGAIRDVIRRAYQEQTYGAPYLVDTPTARGIRIDGAKNGYVVVPAKEDTGEIHSLTIMRVAR